MVGGALVVLLLLVIACQNGAAAAAYGSAGTVWRDDVAPRYPTVAPAPSGPARVPADHSPLTQGLPLLPGAPLNPVWVNDFEPEPPGTKLAKIGQDVMNASQDATEPLPPRFEPLPELGPQRMWQPTWHGCQSTFVDKACEFFYPNPRLWARDLDELQFRRSLLAGQDNLFEPVGARQSWIQLLAAEARSKRDKYTRSTPANDLSHTTCTQMARQVPDFVNF
jgi:hypothetical protein